MRPKRNLVILVASLILVGVALSGRVAAGRLARPALAPSGLDVHRAEADPASVRIEPVLYEALEGEHFTVDLMVEGAVDLAGYECTMTFNKDVVEVRDVVNGPFLAESGRDVPTKTVAIDNPAGTVVFAGFSVGDDAGSEGSGLLATIHLEAVGAGDSALDLTKAKLFDTDANEEIPDPITGGFVSVDPCLEADIVSLDSDSPVALGETMHFTPTLDGSEPFTYTWSFDGAGTRGGTDAHPTFTYDQAGTYTVTLDVENLCGQDEEEISVTVEAAPDIEVTPSSFDYAANVGETFTKTLTIANLGGTDLTWALAEDPDAAWLDQMPTSGTVPPAGSDQVTVVFDAGGLTVGETYTTTLTIDTNDPDEDPVEVDVELTVGDQLPDIEVTPLSFTFEANVGETFTKTLTIANVGGADLGWDLTEVPSATWLAQVPISGTVPPAGGDQVTVAFDAGGLTAGETYTTVLTIDSNDPNEDPVEVPVELTVRDKQLPDIEVTPLSFSLVANAGETFNQMLTIANVGGADLAWTLAEQPPAGWLSAGSSGGTIGPSDSAPVALAFDAAGLTVGETYTTTLLIESDDPNESRVEVAVELEIQQDLPDIDVTPLSLSVTANLGESVDRLLTIANVGGADLTWTLAEQPPVGWLSASSTGNTLAPLGSDGLTISFDATGLAVGTHTTDLVIGSNDPNEDPVVVAVELTVGAYPDIDVTPASLDVTLDLGETANRTLTIDNVGGANLEWLLTESPTAPWLYEVPTGPRTVAPGEGDSVTVNFDATGLTDGETYTTTLVISSDDPNENPVRVPVSLTVAPCQDLEIQFIDSNSPVMIGETMHVTATVTGTDPSYVWDFGGPGSGTGLTTATPSWTYADAGDYTVTLTVSNPCSSDDDTLPVQVEMYDIYLPIIARNHTP